ncbi:hypothetical protein BKA62DRAFT_297865 [Auriculariales sp. MPI-PUGE-AT-0066]|nr:hypothetical protein BKA62DRAFT_297865 [Auriculariales sp. MPI-PUGE-AT-0066]
MEAPSKRVLTLDVYDASRAMNTFSQRNDFISDDLTARLQNVGSRVRKSVAEGYTTPAASPLTQSPVKQLHTTPTAASFLPTSNQILHSVFGKATPSPSPSPRKRTRVFGRDAECDAMECCDDNDSDSSDEDDEDVLIVPQRPVGGGFPNALAGARPVRGAPLRRPRIAQPVFTTTAATTTTTQQPDVAMDFQPIRVAVAVGGGVDSGSQV